MIKRHKNLLIDISVILLLGFLSITWFRGDYFISGGDFGMPLDWVKYLKSMFSTWMEDYSLGAPDYRNIASLIPYALLGAAWQSLGFSPVLIEKIWFFLWFVSGGLSMYYLCSVLGMKRLGRITASVFYMFNPFSLVVIWHVSHALIQMPYSFAPLYLGLYINGLQKKKGFGYIFLFCLIWLWTTTGAYAWPAALIIHWLPIFFFFIVYLIFNPKERWFTIKFSTILILTYLAFNFYWLYPFVASISESFASARSPVLMSDIETLKLTSVKIFEAIRMFGYWALHSGYKGEPYFLYHQFYNSKYIIALSWLVPLLVFLGFAHKEARKKVFLYFSLGLIFFGLFGMKGPHPPLGNLLVAIYQKFPPLALLTRFTILFFGIPTYIIFAVLLGYGFLFLEEKGRKFLKNFILAPLIIFCFLLFVVLVFPFWNGEVIRGESKISPGERVKVPEYWWETKKWLGEQKDFFRIFPLPIAKTYNVEFAWERGYGGGDITRWFTKQPVLNNNTGGSFKIPELIGNLIEKESDFTQTAKILGFLNVKYLLFREDIRWNYILGHEGWFSHTAENIRKFIDKQEDLTLEKKFGQLSFYKIKDDYLLPRIYVPPKVDLVYGTIDELVDIAQYLHPEREKGLLFAFQNNEKGLFFPEKFFEQIFISQEPIFYEEKTHKLTPFVVYNFTVPQEGEYEIFLREEGIKKYYSLSENFLEVVLDENPQKKINFQSAGVNQLSLGRLTLKTGQHQLKILVPPSRNLLADPSFEESRWQGPVDAFPEDSVAENVSVSQSQDSFEGKYSLQIETAGHSPMVYTPIEDFQPGDTYQLSFSTKHITGNPPYFAIWENPVKTGELSMDFSSTRFNKPTPATMLYAQGALPKETSWRTYHLIFKTKDSTQRAGVTFVSYQREPGKTVNLYDKAKVERAFINPIMLKSVSSSSENIIPEISFKKKNSSKYEVFVSGAKEPYILIFSESFHPKWKASVEGKHLIMNGFANGWYVKKLGDYQITIEFGAQKVYYLSIVVSLIALVVSLGYLAFTRKKRL